MKKNLFFVLFSFIFAFGCQKENNEIDFQNQESLERITNVNLLELFEFFNVQNSGSLALREIESNDKAEMSSIIIVVEAQYAENPEDAKKAAYLDASNDDWVLTHVFEKKEEIGKYSTIEIALGFNVSPIYIIEYDLNEEYFSLITSKSFENCFDDCMYDQMDAIANSNWIRKARFLLSAPVEVGWMVAECLWDCSGIEN
ncbi:MAG: hypothetical protein RBS53_12555 [Bacteroidales bacterium]|jgi:hypothetical protein|nr:hypothetical protein [Bacteroidales bacterium]